MTSNVYEVGFPKKIEEGNNDLWIQLPSFCLFLLQGCISCLIKADDIPFYLCRDKLVDVFVLFNTLPNFSAADVYERRVENAYAIGKCCARDCLPLPRINHNRVVGKYVFCMIPAVEGFPVVTTNEKCEAISGEVMAELLQGVPGIGRFRELELIVRSLEMRIVSCCLTHQFQTQMVS